MKSFVNAYAPANREYPVLLESHDKTVVLFSARNTGTVVYTEVPQHTPGEYSEHWVMDVFKELPKEQAVTLKNN